jgi:hypothetical protein
MGGSVVWTLGQSGPAGLEVGDTVGLELQVTNDTPTAGSFSYGSTIADATSGSFYHGDGFWWDRVGGTLFFAPTEAVDQVSFEIRFNKWDGYNSARDGSFVSALLALDAASNNGDARGYGYVVEFIEAYCYHYLDKNGAGERNRTPDRLITNQLLYLLSYASSTTEPSKTPNLKRLLKPCAVTRFGSIF